MVVSAGAQPLPISSFGSSRPTEGLDSHPQRACPSKAILVTWKFNQHFLGTRGRVQE